jgi:hypothetical protein
MRASKGSSRLDTDFHWGNVWNYKPDEYMIDGEWIRSNFRYSYALQDALSVGVSLPVIGRTGGFADAAIEDFHSGLSLGNANRNIVPRNRSQVTVNDHGRMYSVAEGESWGIGDVSVFIASRLSEGSALYPAITVQSELFLPTGDQDELRGMGSPAIALGAVASKRLGDSSLIAFVGAGFQYCDAEDISIIKIRDEQYSGLAGLDYQFTDTFGLIIQYLISSPVAKNYFAFSEPSHEVSAGFKWRSRNGSILEFAVVENVAVFQNSADIGVHLALGTAL